MTALPDILVFGATSLVGSHFVAGAPARVLAAGRRDPVSLSLPAGGFRPVDLRVARDVETVVRDASTASVVNFAARTDVDGIERERPAAPDGGGPAWEVNAQAPEAMARAARASGKYLVQISTDFVFDGRTGPYGEAADRSPFSDSISWYGWTKSEGERRVLAEAPDAAVVRIALPYRSRFPEKLDFARWMVDRRRRGTLPPLYTDQQVSPTWVPDVSRAVTELVRRRASGIFHVASPELTTPHAFASELFRVMSGTPVELAGGSIVSAATDRTRAPRPRHGGLRCERLGELGLRPTSWRDGVRQLVVEEGWA